MRVIAGELKGQRLVAPRGWKVRPTSDRVREGDLFSALGERVVGAPRPRPLLRHGGAGDRGALTRRRGRRPRRPRHPAGARKRRAARAPRARRARPRRRRSMVAGRNPPRWPPKDLASSTSSSSTPPIDSPTACSRTSSPIFPTSSAPDGRAIVESGARPPAGDRLAGATAPAPLWRRRRLDLQAGGAVSERNGTVVCPGTYDPVTNGHVDIITRTSHVFDRVVGRGREQPPAQAEDAVHGGGAQGLHRVGDGRARQRRSAGLLDPLGRVRPRHGAHAIVKGMRAISDFEYEFEMAS